MKRVTILRNIYSTVTAGIRLDNIVSDELPIKREVRQRDLLSPKLFTTVMVEIFKKADISKEVGVDGEHLTNLRFACDAALFKEKTTTTNK